MSDSQPPRPAHPPAERRAPKSRGWRFPFVWMIPIVTIAVGGWLIYDTLSSRGPLIHITFRTAEGLVAGQSHVKHKDVDMGVVQSIALSKDLSHVDVTVRMNRESEPLLNSNAQFWVVKPRFFAGSVSGLDTLLSGSYIELHPSASGGERKRDFEGLEEPPVLQSDVPGTTFLLKARRIGSLSLGSPIFFRDFNVGQVLGWDLDHMAESVTIHAFVRAPFDKYVHDDTRFWNASGASVNIGPTGIQLQLESVRALVLGGIAFDTPQADADKPQSKPDAAFKLYDSEDVAKAATTGVSVHMLARFTNSAAGLARDGAVVLHGVKVGQITGVTLHYDEVADVIQTDVAFDVETGRLVEAGLGERTNNPDLLMQLAVQWGLRAQIESGSLLTGAKQISLDIHPDVPPATVTKQGDVYVIPTMPGGSDDLMTAVGQILGKVNGIPFESIGQNLDKTMAGLSKLANGPELQASLSSLHDTLASVQDTVKKLDAGVTPVLQRLPAITQGLQDTVNKANKLVGSLDDGYGGDSRMHRDLERLLSQVNDAARSIRVLTDLLARHPEALIRGRGDQRSE